MKRQIIVSLLVVSVLVGAAWAFVTLRTDALVARVRPWVDAMEEEWRTQDFERPVVVSDSPEPGLAWEAYERALGIMAGVTDGDDERLVPFEDPETGAMPPTAHEVRDELVARYGDALAWLRRGAARSAARPSIEFRDAIRGEFPPLALLNRLGRLVALAEPRLAADSPDDAVATRLALATLGVDLTLAPPMIAELGGLELAARGPADATLATLPPASLDRLAAGLERIDGRISPASRSLPFDAAVLASFLLDPGESSGSAFSDLAYGARFRFLFSERYLCASAADELRAAAAAYERVPFGRWSARQPALEAVAAEISRTSHPIARLVVPSVVSFEHARRRAIARLRILRMAVDWHRGGDVRRLPDPLGNGDLVIESDVPGAAMIRSAGEDGDGQLERRVGV